MNQSSDSRSNRAAHPVARGSALLRPALAGLISLAVAAPAPRALAPPPVAGPPPVDAAEDLARDDIRFAENLARYRYFTLANEVLATVDGASLSTDLEGRVSHTRGLIYKRASESTADETARIGHLTTAIGHLDEWGKAGGVFSFHERRPDALQDLAEIHHERGKLRARSWNDGGRTDDRLRDDATTDFKDADETYNALLRECESRADQLDDEDNADEAASLRERGALSYYFRGRNAIAWAELEDDPTFRYERAIELLLEYQWEAGAGTISLLYAMHYEAVAHARLGNTEDALDQHQNVIDEATIAFWADLDTFPASSRAIIAELMDFSWGAMAEVQADTGDIDGAQATIELMRAEHAAKQQPFGCKGWEVLLEWGDTLAGLGRGREANDLYKLIADDGRGCPAGEIAGGKLADAVEGGSLTGTSPGVLISAGEGFYKDGKYDQAAYTFQLALANVTTDEERQRHAVEAWIGVAKSLERAKRHLEAALAYERLFEAAQRDAAPRDVSETAALRTYEMYRRRLRETDDPFDKSLRDGASARLSELGIEGDLIITQATERFDEAKTPAEFRTALSDFEAVTEDAPSYERAIVYRGRCLVGAGDNTGALAIYDEMLARAQDPDLEPTNNDARSRRDLALAEAIYYKALLLLDDDVGRPDEALALLDGFETQLAKQTGFHELVKYQRVVAHTMADRPTDGEAALEALREFTERPTYLLLGTNKVARSYRDAAQAAADAGDEADELRLLELAAEHMWAYCELDGFGSFVNLLATGDWFLRVDRCEDAERCYETAIKSFDAKLDDDDLDEARIGLARSLDCQSKFGRSRPYWTDLVSRNPDRAILRGAARSLGGWLDTDDSGQIIEVPGAGEYDEAYNLWLRLYKGVNQNNKYERIWWEAKLGAIYSKYRQGASNSQATIEARKVLDSQRLSTPEYDQSTQEGLAAELRYEDHFKNYFRYLDRKLPTNE